jgi:hypothetical protein
MSERPSERPESTGQPGEATPWTWTAGARGSGLGRGQQGPSSNPDLRSAPTFDIGVALVYSLVAGKHTKSIKQLANKKNRKSETHFNALFVALWLPGCSYPVTAGGAAGAANRAMNARRTPAAQGS